MPKFEESQGFTMPGSQFYGKGNQSTTPGKYTAITPAKHSAYGQPHPINPQGVEQPEGAGHPNTAAAHNVKPKKEKENNSGAKFKSPAKQEGETGKKESDKEFIARAKKQKKEEIDNLTRQAENEGLSGQAAREAAMKEYHQNL